MRALLRRRVMVPAAVAVVLVAVAAGAAWYLLSEERRMGSAIQRALVARTGLPIVVPRARWDGRRLILHDVRLGPGPALALAIRAREVEIDAGILTLVAPAGRRVSVVARSVSIEASSSGSGNVEPLRELVLSFLGWPGELDLGIERGALHT